MGRTFLVACGSLHSPLRLPSATTALPQCHSVHGFMEELMSRRIVDGRSSFVFRWFFLRICIGLGKGLSVCISLHHNLTVLWQQRLLVSWVSAVWRVPWVAWTILGIGEGGHEIIHSARDFVVSSRSYGRGVGEWKSLVLWPSDAVQGVGVRVSCHVRHVRHVVRRVAPRAVWLGGHRPAAARVRG